MRSFLVVLVLIAPSAFALAPSSGREVWLGESADLLVLKTPGGTGACLTTVVIDGDAQAGHRISLRTMADYNAPPGGCEEEASIAWAWAFEQSHELPPAAGDARSGFQHDWTVPANCATGWYHYSLVLAPLGPLTPMRYVYEGECNGNAFFYVLEGNVDFVASVAPPTLAP